MSKKQWYKTQVKPYKKQYVQKNQGVSTPLFSTPKPQREINHTPLSTLNPPKVLTPKKLQKKIAYLESDASPVASFDKISQSTAETNISPAYTQYRVPPKPAVRKVYNAPEPSHIESVQSEKPQAFVEKKKYNVPFKSQAVKLDTDQSKAEHKLKKQKE